IVQGERVATAEQAVYFSKEGQIVLTGSPEVHQGQDLIQGDEITFFLNEERSIVTGQKGGRVTAVFRSQGSKP
ncbi:MAG: LptA/OstA family protein, partial [Desulfuromonadaceae bacterium]